MPEGVSVDGTGRPCGALMALAAALAMVLPKAAVAQVNPSADGRMLGHLPYPEAAAADLLVAPPGFAIGGVCRIHRDAAPDLTRMLAAAALAPGVGRSLRAVSCFRSVAHQRAVFCRASARGVCGNPVQRARFVGPPGYSEHATGYAIDFGVRPSPGCRDVDSCIAARPAGRWLLAHAPEYGFELSFPAGNPQGVTWEPWHWRWVGTAIGALGAAQARLMFARARSLYPASPAVADVADVWLDAITTPPPPARLSTTPIGWPVPLRRRWR